MLGITIVIALPLFLLFKRIQRLEWWCGILAGGFCGACFVAINTLLSFSSDIDQLVDSNNVLFVGLGALTGFVFWWIGVFRNTAFPFVNHGYPIGALAVLPLAAAGIYAHHCLEPTFFQGRLVAIVTTATANPRDGQASVHLTGSDIVRADLSNTWPASMLIGRCVHVEKRWSTLRVRHIYEVVGPFGGGVDDC
jgi:hypothetical protein